MDKYIVSVIVYAKVAVITGKGSEEAKALAKDAAMPIGLDASDYSMESYIIEKMPCDAEDFYDG